jgi:hypothetical protein
MSNASNFLIISFIFNTNIVQYCAYKPYASKIILFFFKSNMHISPSKYHNRSTLSIFYKINPMKILINHKFQNKPFACLGGHSVSLLLLLTWFRINFASKFSVRVAKCQSLSIIFANM